jgi:hypothetical protein
MFSDVSEELPSSSVLKSESRQQPTNTANNPWLGCMPENEL